MFIRFIEHFKNSYQISDYVSGLSQRDLALSKRAEEQLEQERRDQELAKRLQEELNMEQEPESEDARYESYKFFIHTILQFK